MDVKSNDEIGNLAKSIESLTMRLKSYIAYIGESESVLNELANGNLVVELHNAYDGEFAKLKNALITVSETLKETIGKIKESSEAINATAFATSAGVPVLPDGIFFSMASLISDGSSDVMSVSM